MKKLLILLLFVGLGYGIWWFLNQAKEKTTAGEGATKQSEKALKEMEKEDANK